MTPAVEILAVNITHIALTCMLPHTRNPPPTVSVSGVCAHIHTRFLIPRGSHRLPVMLDKSESLCALVPLATIGRRVLLYPRGDCEDECVKDCEALRWYCGGDGKTNIIAYRQLSQLCTYIDPSYMLSPLHTCTVTSHTCYTKHTHLQCLMPL